MSGYPIQAIIFLALILTLFLISRTTIYEIFYFFSLLTKNRKNIFKLTSLLFFPGTILHEMAHFIVAMVLMLRVRDVKIFPEYEGNNIKLGRVLYEKQDVIRGVLVGVAPIFAGLMFFWFVSYIEKSVADNIGMKALILYAMFIVSTTMFSSKQDLVDVVFTIPFILIIAGIFYLLNVQVWQLLQTALLKIDASLIIINKYLFYSLIIHAILILIIKILRRKR